MAENLIHRLIPHQGCVITRTADGMDIAGSAMNWVMSAGVAPFACRAPFAFRVVGRTDSTNLRMHWHRGELIFNWECSVRELRVHDPATAEQHGLDTGVLDNPAGVTRMPAAATLRRASIQTQAPERAPCSFSCAR